MQEDLEMRTVSMSVSCAKFTGRMFIKCVSLLYNHMKNKQQGKQVPQEDLIPHGKQTVKELAAQNQGMTSIEVHDKHIKAFDRVARKYGIDYAVKKVPGCPPRHLIFFKARDQDALDAAFAEFLHKQQVREKRPSIRKLMKSIIDKMPKRDPTRKKDREQTL